MSILLSYIVVSLSYKATPVVSPSYKATPVKDKVTFKDG